MQFSTPVHISPSAWQLNYQDKLLLLGSCFSEHIAKRLQSAYFQAVSNPFGVLYNPLSIANALSLHTLPTLQAWGGLYHSMYHHGDYSFADRERTEEAIRESIRQMQEAYEAANVVIITFGTAYVYLQDGKVVGNCHKMPTDWFERRLLTSEEIVDSWCPILELHPEKKFLFTISPIRHQKDGLHANQVSKATLLLAVEMLLCHANAFYFPSYEIVIDELRDYRFYAEDMCHPTTTAVSYVWERFVETYLSTETRKEMQMLSQLYTDRHHQILHPDTEGAKVFRERLEERTNALRTRYPWI